MNKAYLILIVGSIFFARCGDVNVSTANFSNAKMCGSLTNDECTEDKAVFSQGDPSINTSVTLNNSPADTKVSFSWYYVDSSRTLIGTFNSDLSKIKNNGSTYSLHCSVNSRASNSL